eukprot:scaffold754_cov248-Pinguiococcus_pyrenoidosus.AAC.36
MLAARDSAASASRSQGLSSTLTLLPPWKTRCPVEGEEGLRAPPCPASLGTRRSFVAAVDGEGDESVVRRRSARREAGLDGDSPAWVFLSRVLGASRPTPFPTKDRLSTSWTFS